MISIACYGDTAACKATVDDLASQKTTLDDADGKVATVKTTLEGQWTGLTADALDAGLIEIGMALSDASEKTEGLKSALSTFAYALASVHEGLVAIGERAIESGIAVTDHNLVEPSAPAADASEEETNDYNGKSTAYNGYVVEIVDLRIKESQIHDELLAALRALRGLGPVEEAAVKTGVWPAPWTDPLGVVFWAAGILATAAGAAVQWLKLPWLEFVPYGARRAALSWWQRLIAGAQPKNLGTLPNPPGWLATAEKIGKFGRVAGPIVSGVAAGWDQWNTDQDDPSLTTGQRVARAGVKAGTVGAGAWVGAELGAMGGAAIGTLICPGPGTVIGGIVGGVVGGFAGAAGGGAIGDLINKLPFLDGG